MIKFFCNRDENPLPLSLVRSLTTKQLLYVYGNIERNNDGKVIPILVESVTEDIPPFDRFRNYYRSIGIYDEKLIKSKWSELNGIRGE